MDILLEKKINEEMKGMLIGKIKKRMTLIGITQKEISSKTGIDQRNISRILNSKGGVIQLIRIAESVGLNFTDSELELQTSYWIKNKNELLEYFYTKTNEAFNRGIYRHLDVIRSVKESFMSEFKFLSKKNQFDELEWENVKLDILRIVTMIVFEKIEKQAIKLTPISIIRSSDNGVWNFKKSTSPLPSKKETFSVGEFIFIGFCEKYGPDFFYEELIAKSFELSNSEYVQDIVTSTGETLWVNTKV